MAKRFIRKLTRSGEYSYSLVLPVRVIGEFGWRERQKLVVKVSRRAKRFVIEDWKPKKR